MVSMLPLDKCMYSVIEYTHTEKHRKGRLYIKVLSDGNWSVIDNIATNVELYMDMLEQHLQKEMFNIQLMKGMTLG